MWSMSDENMPGASLDSRQESEILDIILDLSGAALSRADFIKILYQLLEDIAGFENSEAKVLESLVQRLWNEYRNGQSALPGASA